MGKQSQKGQRGGLFRPKQAWFKLYVEQIKFRVDLDNTVGLVGAEEKDIPRAEGMIGAPHSIDTLSSKEDANLALGVIMLPIGAFARGNGGVKEFNEFLARGIGQIVLVKSHFFLQNQNIVELFHNIVIVKLDLLSYNIKEKRKNVKEDASL